MSRGDIGRQEARYRKGLVLGLTIAEAMLLILFALLLALGLVLATRDQELGAMRAQLDSLRRGNALLQAKVDVLGAMAAGRPTDEFFSELVRARQLQAALEKQRAALIEREKRLERLDAVLSQVGGPGGRERLGELAAIGARVEQALKSQPGISRRDAFDLMPQATALAAAARAGGGTLADARSRLGQAGAAARETATLKGQIVALRKDLTSVGKGGDYPPCWVTQGGEIQYLLRVELGGGGSLGVADVTPPERAADRAALPIDRSLFGGAISPQRFLSLTQGVYAASKTRSCRYYAVVVDRTGATQKALYKRLLLTVEAHFYKVLRG